MAHAARDRRWHVAVDDVQIALTAIPIDPELERHPDLAEEIRALLGDADDWLLIS